MTTSCDTTDLAVDAIQDWWGRNNRQYPNAKRLMIEADSGGRNGARSRRYKKLLQDFANESGLKIKVCHYPPGSSKWNPIEHRLFSQVTATWAGHVLSTLLILLGFIRANTTKTGLKVTATQLDRNNQTGLNDSKAEFKAIRLTRDNVCPQWSYTFQPHSKHTE